MILDDIIATKREEIEILKARWKGQDPVRLMAMVDPPRDFRQNFATGKIALIAEIKKASPSAGLIRPDFNPAVLAKTYEVAGASAISVLTDQKYFQGDLAHIIAVKQESQLPILRKDFIIDELQIYESRLAGADAVLLIARILTEEQLAVFLALTEKLGMQALVETHNEVEVERALKASARIIGINNRDLDSLNIDLNTTINLLRKFPELKQRLVISESGIKNAADVEKLKTAGVNGLLIGESLLKSQDIPGKIKELMGT